MSSDPIEVLRCLRGQLGIDADGPFFPSGHGKPERTATVDAALDAAIASLSAPKPESVEAVFNCPTCPVSVQSRWLEPECPECGERCYLDPTAAPTPPRPEASAPVGVEGRAREAVALSLDEAGCYTEANNVRRGIDLGEYRVELSAARIALAQQPAAVDGGKCPWDEGSPCVEPRPAGMVYPKKPAPRAFGYLDSSGVEWVAWDSGQMEAYARVAYSDGWEAGYRAALTAALAGQQQVPPGYVLIAEPVLREMVGDERMDQIRTMCRHSTGEGQ